MIPTLPGASLTTQTVAGLRLLKEGSRLFIEASTLPAKIPSLIVGEQVTARVADQLDNGQLAVLIKNGLFNLKLPQGMQVQGDTLNLRVASLSPAVTFALVDGAADTPTTDGSVQVKLSSASQYLTDLLANAKSDTTTKTVQLDASKEPPAKLAEHLKQGVTQSGLFYESHVQDWMDGRKPLDDVRSEPQNKLGQLLADPAPSTSRPAVQELGNLVQRQLDTLENRQVVLQGMAWPGQPVQVQIQPDETEADGSHSGSDALPAWSTQLSLNLPSLGGMNARIRLVGQTVQVSFVAEESQAGRLIETNMARLQSGMESAGLTLASLVVKHDEAPS